MNFIDKFRKKPKRNPKQLRLFTIVRADMSPGYQLAQSVHGAIEVMWKGNHGLSETWRKTSNTVVCLSAPTLSDLQYTYFEIEKLGVICHKFFEPDLSNELTAISFIAEAQITDKLKHVDIDLALKR